MTPQSNTPEGKVTAEAEAWLTAQGYHETVNAPQGDFADKSSYKTISPTFGFKTVARLLSDYATLQSAEKDKEISELKERNDRLSEELRPDKISAFRARYLNLAALESKCTDLTRQLESAREETTIYRETAENLKAELKSTSCSMDIIKLITEGHFSALRTLLMKISKDKLYAVLRDHNLRYEKQEVVDALVEALELHKQLNVQVGFMILEMESHAFQSDASSDVLLKRVKGIRDTIAKFYADAINEKLERDGAEFKGDIDTVGKCANCGVEFHIHKQC